MRLFIHLRGAVLNDRLRSYVERRLRLATGRFEQQLGDITVQLEDVNGHRGGVDKVCVITAELPFAGRVVVEERGEGFMGVAFRAAHRLRDGVRKRIKRRQPGVSLVIQNSIEAE